MEPFPGLPNTSHDRILEGNKNGLCLGSKSRSHQDNLAGKIYSVRDPSNKPGVTIRIMDNRLEEAKGKDNAAPSADYATHAMKWFKTVPNLYYKSNDDVRKFPPTSASLALNAFRMDKDSPYKKKWISSWYNKGIPELDEDVQKRVRKNDPRLFRSGLGKKYKELVEPVVKYWCNAYLNDSGKKNILFGGDGEVYKTYKKTPEMIAAVEKLASEEPQSFMNYDLVNYPEYAKFSDFPIRNLIANSGSIYFLSNNAEKEWAKPYLDDVIKNAISMEPDRFFKLFNQKDWAKPYLEDIKIPSLRKNPIEFITFIISSRESMATYGKELEGAINAALVESPHIFLKLFSKSNFARPHIQTAKDNIIKEIKENKKMRESRAREICNCVGEESFIKERNAQLNGNSAYGILGCYYFEDGQNEDNDDEDFADDFISKESSAVRVALVKLAKALSSLGLPSESKSIFKI
jgi:hypothetical protein